MALPRRRSPAADTVVHQRNSAHARARRAVGSAGAVMALGALLGAAIGAGAGGAAASPGLRVVTVAAPGAVVVRPGRPQHVVVRGEHLTSIARRYGVTPAALAAANGITDVNRVRVGQRLTVPGADDAFTVPARLSVRPERLRHHGRFLYWARRNAIPADLLMATTWLESGWDNTKVSSTGAVGIGQLMPDTARFVADELIGVPLDRTVADDNIRMSARYLRFLLRQSGGDAEIALQRYYQGTGSIARNGLYADTKAYARAVLALRAQFRAVRA